MEAQTPVIFKTKKSSKSKPSSTSFILLVLLFLVVLASGLAFFYLNNKIKNTAKTRSATPSAQKQKEASPSSQATFKTRPATPSAQKQKETMIIIESQETSEPKRYFEGVRFYEEVNGEKKLLVIEGIVSKIDRESKTISLKREDTLESFKYSETGVVYLDTPSGNQEGSFSDIEVDDFVSYNPVNQEAKRNQATWIIHKK